MSSSRSAQPATQEKTGIQKHMTSFLQSHPYIQAFLDAVEANYQFTDDLGGVKLVLTGVALGMAIAFGVTMAVFCPSYRPFFCWTALMAIFHLMEFVCTAFGHPGTVSYSSFLFNHSKGYKLAILAAVIEYWIESFLFPSFKPSLSTLSLLALPLALAGQVMRSTAMFTAGTSFTHLVALEKRQEHTLITHGVYSLCRHPSYVGWFWWVIAMQILLVNPLSLIAYISVTYRFFDDRIETEEQALVAFFGDQYITYMKNVGVGLPFREARDMYIKSHSAAGNKQK